MSASSHVRQAVHDGPSERHFRRICRAWDRCDADERRSLLPFVSKKVAEWPDHVRVAPWSWWLRAVAGEEDPAWSLVRRLVARDGALAHPALRQIALLEDATAIDLDRASQLRALSVVGSESADLVRSVARGALPKLSSFAARGAPIGAALPRLLSSHSLSDLAVVGAGLTLDDVRALAASPGAASLGALALEDPFGDSAVGAIAASDHLRHLQSLSLARCALGDTARVALTSSEVFAELQALDVSSNAMDARALATAIVDGAFPRLDALRLPPVPLGDSIPSLVDARGWRALAFAGIDPSTASDVATAFSGDTLELFDGRIGAGAAFALANGATEVKNLALRRVGLDDDAWSLLHERGYERLDLSGNALRAVAPPKPSTLSALDLGDNPIDDDGLERMLAAGTLDGVLELNLAGCAITSRGIDRIASADLEALVVLTVGGPGIDAESVKGLSGSVGLCSLETVVVRDPPAGGWGN